jgi:sugar/nucleoside kinase (ribokinase family)
VSGVIASPQATTAVAGVIVDAHAEPAYLGYPGRQYLPSLPAEWAERIQKAEALFVDDWVDHTRQADLILEGLQAARDSGVPSFFDPAATGVRQCLARGGVPSDDRGAGDRG